MNLNPHKAQQATQALLDQPEGSMRAEKRRQIRINKIVIIKLRMTNCLLRLKAWWLGIDLP